MNAAPLGVASPDEPVTMAGSERADTSVIEHARSSRVACQAAESADFPAADRPSPAEALNYLPGDAKRFYYGIGVPIDYQRARHAAYVELARDTGGWFSGEVVLMMLYANGYGVPKNVALAIKLACQAQSESDPSSELAERVMHLTRMLQSSEPFDLCDDTASAPLMSECDERDEERNAFKRARELVAITSSWSPEQLAALSALQNKVEAFIQAHIESELDLLGPDRSVAIAEQAMLRQALLEAVRTCEAGQLPSYSHVAYRASEVELHDAYRKALAKTDQATSITPLGIQTAERQWRLYCDAWVALGRVRYPQVPAEAWKTWLNLTRSKQLREL